MTLIRQAVEAGNFVRHSFPEAGDDQFGVPMGSGRLCARFDAAGVIAEGRALNHVEHIACDAKGALARQPVLRMRWQRPLPPPKEYEQCWRLYDGSLETRFAWEGARLTLTATFNPRVPDTLLLFWSHEGDPGKLPILSFMPVTQPLASKRIANGASLLDTGFDAGKDGWSCGLSIGARTTRVVLNWRFEMGLVRCVPDAGGMAFRVDGPVGRGVIQIGVAPAAREQRLRSQMRFVGNLESLREQAVQEWRRRWGTGCIMLPDPGLQGLWARSLALVLSILDSEVHGDAPAHIAAGSGPYGLRHVALSSVAPALLRLGHIERVRSIVSGYHAGLQTALQCARRVFGVDGALWPEIPLPEGDDVAGAATCRHIRATLHRGAYPARIAGLALAYVSEPQWRRQVAWPVVRETARFFAAVTQRGAHNAWEPIQALRGAAPALRLAVASCLREAQRIGPHLEELPHEYDLWRDILSQPWVETAGSRTEDEAPSDGSVGDWEEDGDRDLLPLVHLPRSDAPDEALRQVYARRRATLLFAGRANNEISPGVGSRAMFWTAASHMGDSVGLAAEMERLSPYGVHGDGWRQCFVAQEPSNAPFGIGVPGLYLQAVQDALLSDFWGRREHLAAVPFLWNAAETEDLVTRDRSILARKSILRPL